MKKEGFIATSLIYSFFLVFIAILAALIRNYVADKMILERFNNDAIDGLNNYTYKLTIVAYDSDIERGHNITNLVQNGDFSEELGNWWFKEGNINAFKNGLLPQAGMTTGALSSYIYQSVPINADKVYYLSVEYLKPFDDDVYVNVDNGSLRLKRQNVMRRSSINFTAQNSLELTRFIIGYSDSVIYDQPVYITNVMLVNLTDHFEKGNVPTAEWMDENIDYFDGTISYIIEDYYSEDSYEVQVAGAKDYKKAYLTCESQNDAWPDINSKELETKLDVESDRYLTTIRLENITDDIKCNVRWSK